MQMFERNYLLNPFLLKTSSDEELSKQINKMVATYRKTDIMADVAYNINLESDLLMIYGEFIARLQEEYSLVKLQADNQEAKAIYQLRNDWELIRTILAEQPKLMDIRQQLCKALGNRVIVG